ncbi:MAG: hypothetical protein IIZ92_14340 [Aquincola sp.]|nr:hypothetical protein [Aquincola sp.]|tara:strand:- start:1 stop:147 length:147 start_codon:yes stop_codon:yes gene_type:complete
MRCSRPRPGGRLRDPQGKAPGLPMQALSVRPWVVHAKTPLAGPAAVLD